MRGQKHDAVTGAGRGGVMTQIIIETVVLNISANHKSSQSDSIQKSLRSATKVSV